MIATCHPDQFPQALFELAIPRSQHIELSLDQRYGAAAIVMGQPDLSEQLRVALEKFRIRGEEAGDLVLVGQVDNGIAVRLTTH